MERAKGGLWNICHHIAVAAAEHTSFYIGNIGACFIFNSPVTHGEWMCHEVWFKVQGSGSRGFHSRVRFDCRCISETCAVSVEPQQPPTDTGVGSVGSKLVAQV